MGVVSLFLRRLSLSGVALYGLGAISPLLAQGVDHWQGFIAQASQKYGVPEPWIKQVMYVESRGNVKQGNRLITSSAGAMGLMQIMPATWSELRQRYALGRNPHDPFDNIMAGTAYLRELYDAYGYPGLFAAYNAGPGRYEEYLAGRKRLPAETRAYLASVTGTRATSASGTEGARSLSPAPSAAAKAEIEREKPQIFFRLAVTPSVPETGDGLRTNDPPTPYSAPSSSGLFVLKKGEEDE